MMLIAFVPASPLQQISKKCHFSTNPQIYIPKDVHSSKSKKNGQTTKMFTFIDLVLNVGVH